MATSPEDPLGDPVTVIKEVQLSEQLTDLGAGQSDGSVAQNVGHTFDDLGVPDWVELPHVSSSPAPGAGCLRHGLLSGHCLRAATPQCWAKDWPLSCQVASCVLTLSGSR